MSSEVTASVIYPNPEGATFDLKYYLDKHMPLVWEKWEREGLKKWSVTQYTEGKDNSRPAFSVAALLTWKDKESLENALKGEAAAEIFGDIPKFTNQEPVLLAGAIVGSQN